MRVLVITNQWPSAAFPARVIVARQVESLRRLGVEIDVRIIEGHASAWAYASAALATLRSSVGRSRYDVVHAHTGHCGVIAMLQVRHPVVVSYVGYDLEDQSAEQRLLHAFERLGFRLLSCVAAASVVKSPRGARRLPRLGRRRAHLIPNGVDLEVFKPMDRAEARSLLGWGPAPRVLFPADPSRPEKRFELARAAFAVAQASIPELELAILEGVDPAMVPVWMGACDLLLLTSTSEGSPNVVKEAMACNLPVVSVDVGDVARITDGATLCHIAAPTRDALGRAIISTVDSLPARSNGRECIARLSSERVAQELVDVYRVAALRGPGPLGFLRIRGNAPGS